MPLLGGGSLRRGIRLRIGHRAAKWSRVLRGRVNCRHMGELAASSFKARTPPASENKVKGQAPNGRSRIMLTDSLLRTGEQGYEASRTYDGRLSAAITRYREPEERAKSRTGP